MPTVPFTLHNAHIRHTHHQIPSSPLAGALDQYKGLSAGVQSRLDLCPQRTNEPFQTKFDDIRFSRSSDMIGAPVRDGLSSLGCDLHIQFNLYIKFEVFAITNYEDV